MAVAARGASRALTLASNGGAITISAAGGIIEGTFIANPGGPGASGGGLAISLASSGGGSAFDQFSSFCWASNPAATATAAGRATGRAGRSWSVSTSVNCLADFGYEYTPIIFTQALVDAVANGGGFFVSSRATPSGGVDPAQYGLNETAFVYLADFFGDISGLFAETKALTVRPQAFALGWFCRSFALGGRRQARRCQHCPSGLDRDRRLVAELQWNDVAPVGNLSADRGFGRRGRPRSRARRRADAVGIFDRCR